MKMEWYIWIVLYEEKGLSLLIKFKLIHVPIFTAQYSTTGFAAKHGIYKGYGREIF